MKLREYSRISFARLRGSFAFICIRVARCARAVRIRVVPRAGTGDRSAEPRSERPAAQRRSLRSSTVCIAESTRRSAQPAGRHRRGCSCPRVHGERQRAYGRSSVEAARRDARGESPTGIAGSASSKAVASAFVAASSGYATSTTRCLIDALLGLARCSFHELAAEGIATAPEPLDSYRGPVLRTESHEHRQPGVSISRAEDPAARRRRGAARRGAACGNRDVDAGASRRCALAGRRLVSGKGSRPRGAALLRERAALVSAHCRRRRSAERARAGALSDAGARAAQRRGAANPRHRSVTWRSNSRCAPTDASTVSAC